MPSVKKPGQRKACKPSANFWSGTNNLDEVPFLGGLDKMSQFWRRYGIDMLKEAIRLSGLARKFELSFLKDRGLRLSSFHTEDLYKLFKDNMVGRLIINFHRHAEEDKIKICETQYGKAFKLLQKVIDYVANVLYLQALSQPMPVGLFTTWNPCRDGLACGGRMACQGGSEPHQLSHAPRRRGKRIGLRQLRVDGYDGDSKVVC